MIATVITVFWKEITEALRDRRSLVSSLVMGPLLAPLLLVGVMNLSIEQGIDVAEKDVTVTVVGAGNAPNLLAFLAQQGVLAKPREGEPGEIGGWIATDREQVVLEIPDETGKALLAGQPARLLLHLDSSSSTARRHAATLRSAVSAWSGGMVSARLQLRGVSPELLQPVVLDTVDRSTPASRAALLLGILSYMVLLVMLNGGLYLAIDATAGERERGSLEPLIALPVPREALIYGKILACVAMMAAALALMLATLAAAVPRLPLEAIGMSASLDLAAAAAIFLGTVPFALVGAGLLTVLASFTRSYKEAQTWLGAVLLVPTLPIAIASMLEMEPEPLLMAVPSLSQHLLMQGVLRGAPLPASYHAISLAGTLALGLLLCWLAGRLYRREHILG